MANNLMFLREKHTGRQILLCKFYPGLKWFFSRSAEAQLNNWLEQITDECILNHGADELIGPTSFELVFDSVENEKSK